MDDAELLQRFESHSIPRAEWTHRLHVRMAYLYLKQSMVGPKGTFDPRASESAFEEALAKIRVGIQRLNAANQVPEERQVGYNETMTVAWARIIHTTIIEQGPAKSSDEFVDRQPQLLCNTLLRLFYSRAIWSEQDCKTRFVEPDLAALPKARGRESLASLNLP